MHRFKNNKGNGAASITFARSAERHGFVEDDVAFAAEHLIRSDFRQLPDGSLMIKLVGRTRDPLVPQIEVIMKRHTNQHLVIFHVSALTDNFWERRP